MAPIERSSVATWCEGCGPHENLGACGECGYPIEVGVQPDLEAEIIDLKLQLEKAADLNTKVERLREALLDIAAQIEDGVGVDPARLRRLANRG